MDITRRNLLQSTGAAALLGSVWQQALAQAQIDTAHLITGFAAGGTSDTLCRRVATKLGPPYANVCVVENRTGAGGQIAINYVKMQPADGATILQTPTSMLTI
ncbi:MAG: tripartite tricarboxylate transporter substrate-binding protein, partial [Variovorax sp.]